MRYLMPPQAMEVEFPKPDAQGSTHGVKMETWLFRSDCFLPEALLFAQERAGKDADLSVVSAACSVGAEVDSVLAIHGNAGLKGEISIEGFDINRLAIETARRGLYTVYGRDYYEQLAQEKALKDMGFDILAQPFDVDSRKIKPLKAAAAPVREGRDVSFTEHDLQDPLPAAGEANLVLANNMLYYLSSEKANRVLRNLCDALADNGVLSLGALTMDGESTPRKEETLQLLEEEFGLKPLFSGGPEWQPDVRAPVIFGRA